MIEAVGIDADDTLWHEESDFMDVSARFHRLLEQYLPDDLDSQSVQTTLDDIERTNLHLFGYGIKAFTLSLIETAIAITDGKITSYDIHQIINWGKELLARPVALLDGVAAALPQLAAHYRLIVITKGDLWNQEAKVARSGLEQHFERVEVVADKNAATYRRVLNRNGIQPQRFVMVGNSLRSDIAPPLELGARAIHIDYPSTWALEQVPDGFVDPADYTAIDSFADLPQTLQILETET